MLYGTLILLSGASLLAITYGLVVTATRDVIFTGQDVMVSVPTGEIPNPGTERQIGSGILPPEQVQAQAHQLKELQERAIQQHNAELHQLLTQSATALGIMAIVSVALGWIVAGRVLRSLSTITRTVQDISATNLHERLALDGPDDELKELGDTFDSLLGRLEASFRSQRQFVANASHELRTPLARQRTMVQVAMSDPDVTIKSLRAALDETLTANQQQDRLIEALLTLARSEAGLDRREPLDLADVTDRVLLARGPEATRRGLHLTMALNPARTAGDPHLVERLVINLVDNAVRHNIASGGVHITTGISAGQAVLSITNTGPIIPATEIGRLFQPFQRLGRNRTNHDEGLGLGLSIVQAIAAAHDATLAAHSRPDGGMQVTVTFPSPPRPSRWKSTPADLEDLLARIERHEQKEPNLQQPADGNHQPAAPTTAASPGALAFRFGASPKEQHQGDV
ncbi:ATP-binding protein [Micromonospora sp. DR5-3]|nr:MULTISPECIES: ATP-binding protein [unclassified Micromonospora]MCW3819395.1 ATP-binding protein [Micromonospora sp. DR5-3]